MPQPDSAPPPPRGPRDVVPGGQAPALPPDEAERLADLRELGVLDYGKDPDLESLADLAALIADTRIALLSIVEEDEQVFKAAVGLDAESTPRDLSFCGHAILGGPAPMVVPDAREDARFADNPLVTGDPHVVFYAGIPLLTSRGHSIGTLCVVDDKPRELTERQMKALERLAGQAAGLIEARGREMAARRRESAHDEEFDERTGLPMRDSMVAQVATIGEFPLVSSALAIRAEEIDAAGPRGGLMADGALRAIARAILGALPASARMARAFGTFVILLPGADGAAARGVVAGIRNRLRGAIVVEPSVSVHVGLTAGVATAGHGAQVSPGDLVSTAEDALRQTPTFGLTCMVVDEDAQETRARTAAIRSDLAKAVTEGQLVVHYQPIVRLLDGQAIGAEALVRWRHPELGLIPPDEFIPFAEDMGIIQEIDRYVLRRALSDLASGAVPGSEVSVNVSPVSIRAALPAVVSSDLREARVTPRCLVLELTERVRFDRDPDVAEILRVLGDEGVRIAIDDFGAGTTSLAHLRSLPVSRLKLDRSLITDLVGADAERANMIVRTLAGLADQLGIQVLAEGVEEAEQRDALVDAGIPLAQGYFFGRPGPLREA